MLVIEKFFHPHSQEPYDPPDIVTSVLVRSLRLLELLKSEMVFGKPQTWLYSIE